ncbi:Ser/Thr protein phosphatase [Tritrichomonas foetus]|uniref:Serine/threonine-protein phosphatase n=1 Tax=Tritrichomonas foetus TaxID=1144522 RepID=A0A1J4K1F1_9EUKA|nr:Ser/Thr protein phosphatase [Tritrichomonas foetus]|eukprot:OHT05067.1 Ser/Thr protein phosphatase [Tritrichomonas foetus]
MEAAQRIFDQYLPFIEKSRKGPDANNENDTIFPRVDQATILKLCEDAMPQIEPLGGLIRVSAPFVYVGDVHSNLTDLLQIFHIFGLPPKTRYLFLGDYVDRGSHSIEVISILFALVCKFPNDFYLIRGNHEFATVNKIYGFYEETLNSYGTEDVWSAVNKVFGYLPLAAIVSDQVFCVHGGLSPKLEHASSIGDIDLPVSLYEETELISDLVWSDPVDEVKGFEQNKRGSGVLYGPDATATFLKNNKLKVILRGHQCVPTGYSLNFNNQCITLFSSSDYHRLLQNKAGAIVHKENRDLVFYTLLSDSEANLKPKMTMTIASGQQLGLKKSQTKTTSNTTSSNSGSTTILGRKPNLPKPPQRSPLGTNSTTARSYVSPANKSTTLNPSTSGRHDLSTTHRTNSQILTKKRSNTITTISGGTNVKNLNPNKANLTISYNSTPRRQQPAAEAPVPHPEPPIAPSADKASTEVQKKPGISISMNTGRPRRASMRVKSNHP